MADQNSSLNIPWAGLAVVVALVSGTLLAPGVFDQLRPPEKERAQPPPGVDMEIDARLWEDPFFALRRFQAERDERCSKPAAKTLGGAWLLAECRTDLPGNRDPAQFLAGLKKNPHDKAESPQHLLVLALVPGNPFVGAEESRRRTRYALLAGLQSQDFVPDEAERIGVLQFDLPAPAGAAGAPAGGASAPGATPGNSPAEAKRTVLVPYELLSQRPLLRGDMPRRGKRYTQVALLWVDEASLPTRRFDTVARMVDSLVSASGAPPTKLVVIGPSSSDALRIALSELSAISAAGPVADERLRSGYKQLAKAEFLNAAATASDNQLEELDGQRLQNFLNARFAAIIDATEPPDVKYRRMLATDSTVLRSLVNELKLRMPAGPRHRVILVAERDSLYAQGLVSELRYRIRREVPDLSFDVSYYYRGLDGVTTRDSVPKAAAAGDNRPADDAGARRRPMIEWPETRDQLDYLRRMAATIKDSEARGGLGPISAIGILGSDVHDKLLVLQALHETFSDKVFFTTDMDARYLHPRTLGFTRNLIVASSLPLKIAHQTSAAPPAADGDAAAAAVAGEDRPGLQTGTPPLRDMYQTATYLAARRAACRDEPCRRSEDEATRRLYDAPSIYEIGRNRAVPVAGYAFETRLPGSSVPRAVLAAVGFSLVALLLLVWPSTPSLQRVRQALAGEAPDSDGNPLDLPSALMAALHVGLLAFALGSLIELIEPGNLGFIHILFLTALAGFATILGLHPQIALAGGAPASARRRIALNVVLVGLLVAALAWMGWRAAVPAPCPDCEPVEWLEGVSAWPSHLLHLIALFAIAVALDYSWSYTAASLATDSQWMTPTGALRTAAIPKGLCSLRRHMSLAGWRRAPRTHVCFRSLWWQYAVRGQNIARIVRVLFWVAVTVLLATLLFWVFNEGRLPAVPARGGEHRDLFGWTLGLCVMLLTVLIVAVADATMLSCRFIWYLNRGRTSYPRDVVASFARALGPDRVDLWTERIAADPDARGPASKDATPPRHTLLDDWIDVQVVARRTELIAPLVIGPFVVVALLVVARSRLFDNWSLTLPIAAGAGAYLLWLILLAVLLKTAAEQTRRRALARMQADLRWLRGSARHAPLVQPFEGLMTAVQNNDVGAFAGFFDQPLFKALLVPLGGVGGAQLFDYFLLAR